MSSSLTKIQTHKCQHQIQSEGLLNETRDGVDAYDCRVTRVYRSIPFVPPSCGIGPKNFPQKHPHTFVPSPKAKALTSSTNQMTVGSATGRKAHQAGVLFTMSFQPAADKGRVHGNSGWKSGDQRRCHPRVSGPRWACLGGRAGNG